MSEQRNDHTTTESQPDLPLQHQVTDPITGTTAAGPFEKGSANPSPSSGWGTAARWLALALLLAGFVIVIYWITRG